MGNEQMQKLNQELNVKLNSTFETYKQFLIEERRWVNSTFPFIPLEEKHVENCRVLSERKRLLEKLGGGKICEIGVDTGIFSESILDVCTPEELHLVDPWLSDRFEAGYQLVTDKFAAQISSGQVKIHRGTSEQILPQLPDNYFDWMYIDSVHDYHITAKELIISASKVKEGGIIAGHDYAVGNVVSGICYGVINAVHEFIVRENWEIIYMTLELAGLNSFAIRKIK